MSPTIIIGLIGALVPLVNNVLSWIDKAQTTLKQSTELTPEQEKELDGYIDQIDAPSWWKIDSD
jgi:hypothetical protein